MTHYMQNGTSFMPVDPDKLNVKHTLPPGTYTIAITPQGQYFFERIESFVMPARLYGDTVKDASRIMRTFEDRPNSTGVLLTGEPGSGKSLLLKQLAVNCAVMGMPTVVINQPHLGDAFFKLLQDMSEPAMIAFDEFEKVYPQDKQEGMLTLLDGMFPSKKLFVLTCNDKYRINGYMKNRPGRIFYMKEYRGLDQAFVEEYCLENLDNKDHVPNVGIVASMFGEFNFDMLKSLVEEMNRYAEPATESMKMLNIKPYLDDTSTYTMEIHRDGKKMEGVMHEEIYRKNPLSERGGIWNSIDTQPNSGDEEDDDGFLIGSPALVVSATAVPKKQRCFSATWIPSEHLVALDHIAGTMSFLDPATKLTLVMIRKKQAAALPQPW